MLLQILIALLRGLKLSGYNLAPGSHSVATVAMVAATLWLLWPPNLPIPVNVFFSTIWFHIRPAKSISPHVADNNRVYGMSPHIFT